MLPEPTDLLEAPLWKAHADFDDARSRKSGIAVADEAARNLVAEYVRGTELHRDALRSFLSRLDAEEAYLAKEIARLNVLRNEAESDRRRFRAHVLNTMRDSGLERVRGHKSVFQLVKAPPRIEVQDTRLVPERFIDVTPEHRKLCVKRALDERAAGEAIPGLLFIEGERNLSVR